ncbi:membrane protein insertase YidC [Anaeromicropila herbilytica]|uniref:Uncharacterized protein n=1 Tax=Anaeromicropila herbilytica TaxID=2785025 RepID=A0A7R7ENZ0_9FIRM|nr:hypothetical protein [Anaeromicropila herbilytica]BCN32292.1 hypothetical protein bsdtb5_35870 [Anaeromicropila herbilytica]
MKKMQRKQYSSCFILLFSLILINVFTLSAHASTKSNSEKQKEMNQKIAVVQKKYEATEYDTYHLYCTYQVTAKVQNELYKGYNKESMTNISKAKTKLAKISKDNSLYGLSRRKQLKRIILKEETELKINKVTLESYNKNYPIYKLFMDGLTSDPKNFKSQINIIKLNYNYWKSTNYAWEKDTPVLFKCYDEINKDLEMWKNSNDIHKKERIKSLIEELENPNNGYTALDLKKTQTANLNDSRICYAYFKELNNIIKKYTY